MTKTYEKLDDLIASFKECKDEKKKRMLHLKIVEDAMTLVKKIANTISMQSGVSNEDLVQVGSLGLIKAIEAYKLNMNTRFRTYATYFIKGEIKHYLRDKAAIIKAPRELQELVFKISSTAKKLAEEGVEDPSAEDIANILGISEKKVEEVMNIDKYKTALSLDQYLKGEDEDLALVDRIPSGDYREFMNSYEDKIMLSSAIDKLSPELKQIIELSYYEDLNQREIAERVHISQMQVSRRLKKALNKMYELIKNYEK